MDPHDIVMYLLNEEEEEEEETAAVLAMYANANHLMQNPSRHVGSVLNHRTINRDRAFGHQCIYRDYFSDNPTYPDHRKNPRKNNSNNIYVHLQE